MKIKVLEYQKHRGQFVKVFSHKKNKNNEWKNNDRYEFHKMLLDCVHIFPVIYKKEYSLEKE